MSISGRLFCYHYFSRAGNTSPPNARSALANCQKRKPCEQSRRRASRCFSNNACFWEERSAWGPLRLPCSCGFLLWPPLSIAKELEGCWEKPRFRHGERGGHKEQSRATSQNLMDFGGTRAGGPIANVPWATTVDVAEVAPANSPRGGQTGRSGRGRAVRPVHNTSRHTRSCSDEL